MTLSALGIFSAAGAGGVVAAPAYELIETQILGSSQASVVFSSLGTYSSTYKHLQVRMTMRTDRAAFAVDTVYFRLNGDTASNYAIHILTGDGSSVGSGAAANSTAGYVNQLVPTSGSGSIANNYAGGVFDILDAFQTTKFKTSRSLSGSTTTNNFIVLASSLHRSTDAVSSITFYSVTSSNFVAGSRFSLYGIKG